MLSKAANRTVLPTPIIAPKVRMSSSVRALAQWAAIDAGDKVLDMACGNGELLFHLGKQVECELCGIVPTMEQVRTVRSMIPTADIMYAQPEDIPWKDASFDVVLCSLPFYLMEDPGKVLQEAIRVLKPGGEFLMAADWYPMPLRQVLNYFFGYVEEPQRPICYGKHEMLASLESVGFQKVTWRAADIRVGVTIGWKKSICIQA